MAGSLTSRGDRGALGRTPGAANPTIGTVILEFSGDIFHWRGPSPFHFVEVPDEPSAAIESVATIVTYGWGVIPVTARIGRTEFHTSLFPRNEHYLVPIKVAVRNAEHLSLGDRVDVRLELDV